ncbi:MAG: hypothetical protein QXI32_00505 [Candidatus Bathyarchaeia archaeon]
MKSYLEATSTSTVEIGGVQLPRLILGNLPFLGESYQGPEMNKVYFTRFSNPENTFKVVKKAISTYGLTVIGVMPPIIGGLSRLFFEVLQKVMDETQVEIGLVSCFMIPLLIGGKKVDDYRRWITYYSIESKDNGELAGKYLNDPILLCRDGWKEGFAKALRSNKPYSDGEIADMTLDRRRLDCMLDSLSTFHNLLVEPGSETDFLALTGRVDILQEVVEASREKLGCPVVVGTHHAGSTIPILENSNISISGYVTPVNAIGALMLPSRKKAFEALTHTKHSVIAIKPLAGGRIAPEEAFEYVFKKARVAACMIGVASEDELRQDVQAAQRFIANSAR